MRFNKYRQDMIKELAMKDNYVSDELFKELNEAEMKVFIAIRTPKA